MCLSLLQKAGVLHASSRLNPTFFQALPPSQWSPTLPAIVSPWHGSQANTSEARQSHRTSSRRLGKAKKESSWERQELISLHRGFTSLWTAPGCYLASDSSQCQSLTDLWGSLRWGMCLFTERDLPVTDMTGIALNYCQTCAALTGKGYEAEPKLLPWETIDGCIKRALKSISNIAE